MTPTREQIMEANDDFLHIDECENLYDNKMDVFVIDARHANTIRTLLDSALSQTETTTIDWAGLDKIRAKADGKTRDLLDVWSYENDERKAGNFDRTTEQSSAVDDKLRTRLKELGLPESVLNLCRDDRTSILSFAETLNSLPINTRATPHLAQMDVDSIKAAFWRGFEIARCFPYRYDINTFWDDYADFKNYTLTKRRV